MASPRTCERHAKDAHRSQRAKRALLAKVGCICCDANREFPTRNCVLLRGSSTFPANSRLGHSAPSSLVYLCDLPSQAIRLRHSQRERTGAALRRRHRRSGDTPSRAQCRAESVDNCVEAVVHRRVRRVPDRAPGDALRAVPEVRRRPRLREASLRSSRQRFSGLNHGAYSQANIRTSRIRVLGTSTQERDLRQRAVSRRARGK
jgi:hypothetical protein